MEVEKHQSDVSRFERFQSLQAGQYWRARETIGKKGIDKGEVLLLESIKWVDEAAHTIVVRAHPLKYDTRGQFDYVDAEGVTRSEWVDHGSHRFLLDDFLKRFEFEPDAETVREAELAAVQQDVNAIKSELVEFRTDPALSARVVEDGLREADTKAALENPESASLPALSTAASAAAASVAVGTVGNALSSGITEQKIEMIRQAAGREHQIATIKSNWIAEKTKSIASTIKKMTPFYQEQAAAAMAQTEDVRTYVAKILKGIGSLDLYVGKDVDVDTIMEGASAPSDVPLSFVQRKLCMDEELATCIDVDAWFDFTKHELFFQALREMPELVAQIFPTERCVLVMATSRRNIDYGDGIVSAMKNQINRQVFMLVRDGGNVYRVHSPVESHLGASKLFPSRGDGDALFRGFDGSQIKFDDLSFTDRLSAFENAALHYKRFLIMAAGLDHRRKLFGDFYPEEAALEFISEAFQEKYCAFIRDADPSASLPGEKREDLRSWVARNNLYLQSGSRVICNWPTLLTNHTAPAAVDTNVRDRDFVLRYLPKQRAEVKIAYRDGQSVCVEALVHGETLTYKERSFKCRVDITAFRNRYSSDEEIAYLCLDRVSPEELDWYIHNRGVRKDHISYIRLFKIAAKLVKAERALETGVRAAMAEALIAGKVAAPSEIPAVVDTAVAAWRAANRGKPLPTSPSELSPSKWKALLDQMFHVASGGGERAEMAERFLAEAGLDPLRLVVGGDGRIAVYAAPAASERDDRMEPHAWVHRISLDFRDGAASERSRKWTRLPRQDASENVLKEWGGASGWLDLPSLYPSFDAKRAALDPLDGIGARLRPFASAMSAAEFDVEFEKWKAASDGGKGGGLALPFGALKINGYVTLLCVGVEQTHVLLHAVAPDDDARERVKSEYVRRWYDKQVGAREFRRTVSMGSPWRVFVVEEANIKVAAVMYPDNMGTLYDTVSRQADPVLGDSLLAWVAKQQGGSFWFAADARDESGGFALDGMLGLARPEGYGPYQLLDVTFRAQTGGPLEYGRWVDVSKGDAERGWADRIESLRPEGYSSASMVTRSSTVATHADVERRVASYAREEGKRAVKHTDLPAAPQPPAGSERWFFV